MDEWRGNTNTNMKRKRCGKESAVEEALLKWFQDKRKCHVPISGLVLEEKANEIAKILNIDDFKATSGWLSRWKSRNQICFKKSHGESADASIENANSWKADVLPTVLKNYELSCIYNCDETALYYRATPDGSLCFKKEKLIGGKICKDRLTILCCSNADGSHKLPLYVIGKSKKPRCLRHVKSLPTTYRANNNAWMTSALFKEWLLDFNKTMRLRNRKALLLLDNCSAHKVDLRLENVTLQFLPAKTTSIMQPLDQGIISLFKRSYRQEVVKKIVASIDTVQKEKLTSLDIAKKISLLCAIHMMNKAWNKVSDKAIVNCFSKCGFIMEANHENIHVPDENVSEWMSVEDFNNFVDFDGSLPPLEDVNIDIQPEPEIVSEEEDDPAEAENGKTGPSSTEVFAACETIRQFLEVQSNVDFSKFYELERQVGDLLCRRKKQKKITDFF